MNAWTRFKLKILRKETPFYARLHTLARAVLGMSMPVIPGLHRMLYAEWAGRTAAWHSFWRIVYYEPMFKSMCRTVGPGFKLWYAGNGVCRIFGHLNIHFGANVHMFDNMSLAGVRAYDEPELRVGDNTYLGPALRLMIAQRITIGRHCIFGNSVSVFDNPGHPLDAAERLESGGGLPPLASIRPVSIGDFCFVGPFSVIYPGVTLGDGAFVRTGTHVHGEIPPFALIGGQPWRLIRLLPISPHLCKIVGEERVAAWHAQRRAYCEANNLPYSGEEEA